MSDVAHFHLELWSYVHAQSSHPAPKTGHEAWTLDQHMCVTQQTYPICIQHSNISLYKETSEEAETVVFEEEAIKGAAVLSVSPVWARRSTWNDTASEYRFPRDSLCDSGGNKKVWTSKLIKNPKPRKRSTTTRNCSEEKNSSVGGIVQRNQTVSDDGSEKDTGICLEVKDTPLIQ